MIRLTHAQTVQGHLLVDDIDDQLPNKTVHRLGSCGDPNAYKRDGYANEFKQECYIPRVDPTDSLTAGYIDLKETPRVLLSRDHGKIYKLETAGLISVSATFYSAALTSLTLDNPTPGDLTIAGTGFTSLSPSVSEVRLFGDGVGDITLTQAEIEAAIPASFTATSIVIDNALVPGLTIGDSVTVTASGHTSTIRLVS